MSYRSTPTPQDHMVGSRFGGYHLDELIGVGGMGRVYKATGRDGACVALKIIKSDFARDETFRRRFRREARIAQTVRNRHLVAVLDTGEENGLPYMVAQFIEGVSLQQKLKQEGPLDLPTTVRICLQVADGLRALSSAGMVHRDVTPGNILLDRGGTAYLTDFGLAKDSQGSVLTVPGQALGSIDYMAPEQIRGEQVSGATDIYSLGCVMFACVNGHPPFADRQGMRVLWAHLQDEPPDPSAQRPDLPPRFAEILKMALRKEPSERPQSSMEYARLLSLAAGISIRQGVG